MLLFNSCKKDTDKVTTDSAYFGGEIINPNSDYIVLAKSGEVIDTLKLNNKNRFGYTLEHVEPGIYEFYDSKEFQTFILQPNDSLLLRLNTIDFDHSLVYTGIGAKENNFLMNLFLDNEKEDNKLISLCQLEPLEFESNLKALKEEKEAKLAAFKKKNNTTNLFNILAESTIKYKYYTGKEFYPFANYQKPELDILNSLPKDFYNYRKNINPNDSILKDSKTYITFLRFYINNLALQEHFKHSEDMVYNNQSLDYNLDKMKIIDSLITNQAIKNELLYHTITHFISSSNQPEAYNTLFTTFKNKCNNKKYIDKTAKIVNAYNRLKPGLTIPEILLVDKNNQDIPLPRLVKKPTVFYFWSKFFTNHLKEVHKKAIDLQKKYPEISFIAINIDTIDAQQHQKILKSNNFSTRNEYRFKYPEEASKTLSIDRIINVFIIDKNKKIVNPKANMFNIRFEQELLGLINQ